MKKFITQDFILPRGKSLTKANVTVTYSKEQFGRRPLPSQEQIIDKIWAEKSQTNPRLYNGTKFRLASCDLTSDHFPILSIGLTNYKDFLGTNCAPNRHELQKMGTSNHGDKQAYLSDPLGVGSLLLTTDQQFVFVWRAKWTAEEPNKMDRSGGHPEPDMLTKNKEKEHEDLSSQLVCEELFTSVLREIKDELNVDSSHLGAPKLLGMVRNQETAGRPSLEFFTR